MGPGFVLDEWIRPLTTKRVSVKAARLPASKSFVLMGMFLNALRRFEKKVFFGVVDWIGSGEAKSEFGLRTKGGGSV